MMGNFRLLIAVVLVLPLFCHGTIFNTRKLPAVKRSHGECFPNERACNDGTCIRQNYFCDSWVDCSNGEDDLGCGSCTSEEFMCSDESCIPSDKICNGVQDCPNDESDERGCSNYRPFDCDDRKSITNAQVCDSIVDCSDAKDELKCGSCSETEFRCNDGVTCVSKSALCNGTDDCGDNSDEDYTTCANYDCGDRYKCQEGTCIAYDQVCDSNINCPAGTEERGCNGCPDNHFKCGGGECIQFSAVCDQGYYKDCPDRSDETGCPVNNAGAQKRVSKLESLKTKKGPQHYDPIHKKEKMYEAKRKQKIDESKRREQQKAKLMEELRALDKELKERIGN